MTKAARDTPAIKSSRTLLAVQARTQRIAGIQVSNPRNGLSPTAGPPPLHEVGPPLDRYQEVHQTGRRKRLAPAGLGGNSALPTSTSFLRVMRCWRRSGCRTIVVDQNIAAEDENPQRKREKRPIEIAGAEQKEKRQHVAEDRQPAGRYCREPCDRGQGNHEHGRH